MSVKKIGIRNEADVIAFLSTDWLRMGGNNNCMMYGVGMWGNNSGKVAPYSADMTLGNQDVISSTIETAISSAEWTNTGEVYGGTSYRPPSKGYVYFVDGSDPGSGSQRVFQFSGNSGSQERSSWKSYVGLNCMWVGDTVPKRCAWFGTAGSISTLGGLPNPSSNPYVPGTNTQYGEEITPLPEPPPPP